MWYELSRYNNRGTSTRRSLTLRNNDTTTHRNMAGDDTVEQKSASTEDQGARIDSQNEPSTQEPIGEVCKQIASAFEASLKNHVPLLDAMFLRQHILSEYLSENVESISVMLTIHTANVKILDRVASKADQAYLEPSIIITKHDEDYIARVVCMSKPATESQGVTVEIIIEGPPATGGAAGEHAALWGLHALLQREMSNVMAKGVRDGDLITYK